MQDLEWLIVPFLLEMAALAYVVLPRNKGESRDRGTETANRPRARNEP
jgi:hypothetical protein